MNYTVLALPAKHAYLIRSNLVFRLHSLEDDLSYYKEMVALYWSNCDVAEKELARSKVMFHNLNRAKERCRQIRKELKLIRETLKALK